MCLPKNSSSEPASLAAAPLRSDEQKVLEATFLRVLIADDNEDAANALTELLRAQGHEVRCVYNGEDAVEAAKDFYPQLVLLDTGMPKLNGYEACKSIQALQTPDLLQL